MRWLRAAAGVLLAAAVLAPSASAAGAPHHYDVPHGFTRCAHATAWNGFFKWASVQHTTCTAAAHFLTTYAKHASVRMPRHVDAYTCSIRYWRNEDGDIYASRHVCHHDSAVIRFYGMV